MRLGLKEAGVQVSEERDSEFVSRRTETSYKAESLGKAAQHVKARGTGDTVNGAVAQRKFTFLSGEICFLCGIMLFPVKLPAGATGSQMSRHR